MALKATCIVFSDSSTESAASESRFAIGRLRRTTIMLDSEGGSNSALVLEHIDKSIDVIHRSSPIYYIRKDRRFINSPVNEFTTDDSHSDDTRGNLQLKGSRL